MATQLELRASTVFLTPSKTVVCIPPSDVHIQLLFDMSGNITGYKYFNKFTSADLGTLVYPASIAIPAEIISAAKVAYLSSHAT